MAADAVRSSGAIVSLELLLLLQATINSVAKTKRQIVFIFYILKRPLKVSFYN